MTGVNYSVLVQCDYFIPTVVVFFSTQVPPLYSVSSNKKKIAFSSVGRDAIACGWCQKKQDNWSSQPEYAFEIMNITECKG